MCKLASPELMRRCRYRHDKAYTHLLFGHLPPCCAFFSGAQSPSGPGLTYGACLGACCFSVLQRLAERKTALAARSLLQQMSFQECKKHGYTWLTSLAKAFPGLSAIVRDDSEVLCKKWKNGLRDYTLNPNTSGQVWAHPALLGTLKRIPDRNMARLPLRSDA